LRKKGVNGYGHPYEMIFGEEIPPRAVLYDTARTVALSRLKTNQDIEFGFERFRRERQAIFGKFFTFFGCASRAHTR